MIDVPSVIADMRETELNDAAERWKRITERDVAVLYEKELDYQGSWKRRGGVGAFMMLARKFDRLEAAVKRKGYDIFHVVAEDGRQEGILDDIADLRRYLLLVEEHCTRDK